MIKFKDISIKNVFLLLIKFYQKAISPYNPGVCRFEPTCSTYSYQAIERHGLLKGLFLSVRRILRCNFLNPSFGYDPVPDKFCIKNKKI